MNATDRRILNKLKKYEGKTVEDFMYSDLVEFIGIDVLRIDGKEPGYGEEYDDSKDGSIIRFINVRNVMGYIFADITTEESA